MQKSGETVEFVYNENGLRVQKTATSTGVTKYTLHGKNVVHMTQGSNEMHFFYDAQNKPAVVVFNGTPYSYVKNLQGDIVAILDSSKNVVVSYVYDAWGRPISCSGTMANTLGKINPFRYRGYVYDEETGLYYLRSRYYSIETCRFANADILLYDNLFSYCDNSPIDFCDVNGFDSHPGRGYDPVSRHGKYKGWYYRIDDQKFLDSPHIHILLHRHNKDIAEFGVKANGDPHENLPLPNKMAREVIENGDQVKKEWPPKDSGNRSGGTKGKSNKPSKRGGKATSFSAVCVPDAIDGVHQTTGFALPYNIPFSTGLAGNTTGSYMPTAYEPTTFSLPSFGSIFGLFSIGEDDPIMEICFDAP